MKKSLPLYLNQGIAPRILARLGCRASVFPIWEFPKIGHLSIVPQL